MKRAYYLPIGLLLLVILTACGSAEEMLEPTATATAIPEEEAPAAEATPIPNAYPARPTPTRPPEDYPPPQASRVPPAAYPAGGTVWMLRPFGQQCDDESSYAFASLEEAIDSLEEAGVTVEAAETVSLTVCEACNICPTSEHFRVQISADDLQTVRDLGWSRE